MTGRSDLFEESMQLGHSAAWDQEWEKAIKFYRKALAEAPESPDALTSLGLAMLEIGREKEALAAYHQACKINPEDPIPYEKCAEIFEQLGQTKEAIQQRELAAERYMKRRDAEKAVENWTHIGRLAPDNLKARSRLALTNERLGRRKEAVHEYLTAASILQSKNREERATEAIKRALALVPGDSEATAAMRQLRAGEDLPEPGPPLGASKPLRMSQVKAILESPPDSEELPEDGRSEQEVDETVEVDDPELTARQRSLSILAGMLFEDPDSTGNGSGEGLDFDTITQSSARDRKDSAAQPTMYRYLSQAIDYQTRDKVEQAAKEFERSIQAGLNHPAGYYALGFLQKEMGDLEEAKQNLNQAVNHPDLSLGANLALGRMAKDQGDLSEAARHLVQALRIADGLTVDDSKSDELSQLYDSILATQDEGDEESLQKIVENTLEFLSGPEWLSRIRQARNRLRGDTTDSEVVPIARMIALGGSDRVLNALERIDQLVQKDLLSTAMEETMLALQFAPSYLALHRRMAEIQMRQGSNETAVTKLKMVAETHRVRGEAKEASDVYARLLRHSPVNIEARERLIQLLEAQDRFEDALEQYLELAELYRQMAQIESARETLAKAYQHAEQIGASKGIRLQLLRRIGDIDVSRLDWRRALDSYQTIRQLDPENPDARAKIIDLNLRLGQEEKAAEALDSQLEHLVQTDQGGQALDLLEDLVREHPGKQTLHARLAEAYRAADRKADAIAQYDALGELQLDAGQTQKAIQTIQTIIDLEPPDIEGYQELLSNLKQET